MDERPTCGEGLAQNSVLPGKLGELAAAMAENLEALAAFKELVSFLQQTAEQGLLLQMRNAQD